MDTDTVRELVTQWFAALDRRDADTLTGMCHPDVVIRPHRARASAEAVEYRGHEGVRDWVGSLDADTRITLDVFDIDVTGPQSAVIGTDVWLEKGDARTGGPTWSVWRFEDSKLREAIGFESKSEALDAEAARG